MYNSGAMKCPYNDCKKDFNLAWGSATENIYPTKHSKEGDGLYILTYTCRFCERQFHQIFRSKKVRREKFDGYETRKEELLYTFPSVKTIFEAKKIPQKIVSNFNEAERCRSVGSLTGVGACLRKTIYAICDDKQAEGRDYREKISNLPVKGKYQELLKQIKWLGDNTTKPGDERYSIEDADLALQILPLLIEELYTKDEKIEEVEKVLAKVRAK